MDKKMRAAIEAFLRVQASKLESPSPEAEGTGGFADVPHLAPDHETHLSSEAQASTTSGHSIKEVSEVPPSNTKDTPQIPASVALEPRNRKTVSDPENPLSTLQWSQWAPHTQGAKRVEKKRHRRNLKAEERRKIIQNRGMACDKHRLRKVTCNPDFCPENKQNVNKKSMQKFETRGATSITNDVVDKMASAQGVLPPTEANLKYRLIRAHNCSQKVKAIPRRC
ncbi:hypothetical protein B0J14DRAFT_255179 [Halenospora varia]|nr:hypothetical protein B0J14DRAFT_255179 [Halenospora varia]